jgi:cytosine permease
MLPALSKEILGGPMGSWSQFWTIANQAIWTGKAPDGQAPIGFFHVAAFAWICNLAMHGGLSDMAILRYAKRASYGLYSAFGMFLGHYLAWICAGIMGATTAIIVGKTMSELDAGGVAWQSLGAVGIVAVILAGWTTSNPTLYRAGLAFQAVTPGWPRWMVTLLAGAATTVIACSPFVFTKLLDFVGWYGLLLMPVGAIVFVEHWIFPRIGLTQYWASKKKLLVSWPALLSWGIAIAAAIISQCLNIIHLFFLFVPIWLLTSVLYILFASMAGAREKFGDQPDKKPEARPVTQSSQQPQASEEKYSKDPVLTICAIIALVSLAACVILPLWVYLSNSDAYLKNLASFKNILIWPTVIYFISATIWNIKRSKAS